MRIIEEDISGFDRARTILARHDARTLIYEMLVATDFLDMSAITFVHVDNTSRADRMTLTGCDALGNRLATDVHYDDDNTGLWIVPEFSLYYSGTTPVPTSELDTLSQDGWIIDLSIMRQHDVDSDRRTTQRAIMLALLGDMIADGSVHALALGLNTD